MRYNFDLPEKKVVQQPRSPSPATSKEEVQWIALQDHPIFTRATAATSTVHSSTHRTARNLMTWDGASRLYFWDSEKKFLHRISIRLGEPEPTSVLADSPSKVSSFFVSISSDELSFCFQGFWNYVK